jgi:hypothetical protein
MVFRWGRWKKVNRNGSGWTLNYRDVSSLYAVMQDVRAATEAPTLGVPSLQLLLSLIGGSGAKCVPLTATGGRNRRAGVRRTI